MSVMSITQYSNIITDFKLKQAIYVPLLKNNEENDSLLPTCAYALSLADDKIHLEIHK